MSETAGQTDGTGSFADRGLVRSILVFGIPLVLAMGFHALLNLVDLPVVGVHDADRRPEFGETAQAAFGVGLRLDLLAIFSAFGWGAAASTLVGQNFGRGRADRAARATWVTGGLNIVMMTGIAVSYFTFAPDLIRFFGADREIFDPGGALTAGGFDPVIAIGAGCLRISVFAYVFIAVSLVLAQALNGAAPPVRRWSSMPWDCSGCSFRWRTISPGSRNSG